MTTNQQDAMEAAARAFHLNKPGVCEVPWGELPERARQSLMGNAYDVVQAYLAAREAEGFVMVPVEPSDAMKWAGADVCTVYKDRNDLRRAEASTIYRAMLAARPTRGD